MKQIFIIESENGVTPKQLEDEVVFMPLRITELKSLTGEIFVPVSVKNEQPNKMIDTVFIDDNKNLFVAEYYDNGGWYSMDGIVTDYLSWLKPVTIK